MSEVARTYGLSRQRIHQILEKEGVLDRPQPKYGRGLSTLGRRDRCFVEFPVCPACGKRFCRNQESPRKGNNNLKKGCSQSCVQSYSHAKGKDLVKRNREISERYRSGVPVKQMAEEYGIAVQTIYRILNDDNYLRAKRWKDEEKV